jgi:hypothetical protein
MRRPIYEKAVGLNRTMRGPGLERRRVCSLNGMIGDLVFREGNRDRTGLRNSLDNKGDVLRSLNRYGEAIRFCDRALCSTNRCNRTKYARPILVRELKVLEKYGSTPCVGRVRAVTAAHCDPRDGGDSTIITIERTVYDPLTVFHRLLSRPLVKSELDRPP